MREIKFRGKFLDDSSEWLYGNYVFLKDDIFSHKISDNNGLLLDIDEKTLGQYTGLKDKNGVKIFEGDIVKIDCPTMKMQGKVFYCESGADFRIYDEIEDIEETLWYLQEEYEVIRKYI